jgi:hypothetical protein
MKVKIDWKGCDNYLTEIYEIDDEKLKEKLKEVNSQNEGDWSKIANFILSEGKLVFSETIDYSIEAPIEAMDLNLSLCNGALLIAEKHKIDPTTVLLLMSEVLHASVEEIKKTPLK